MSNFGRIDIRPFWLYSPWPETKRKTFIRRQEDFVMSLDTRTLLLKESAQMTGAFGLGKITLILSVSMLEGNNYQIFTEID